MFIVNRLEKLQREERLRQAEREIEEAKRVKMKQLEREIEEARKREQERERAKEKLREGIKAQLKNEKLMKGNLNCKVLVNAQNAYRTSPRLEAKIKIEGKSSPLIDSLKMPPPQLPKYNPPRVPLLIRESAYACYGLDDLSSGDDTDDECQPTKRVPSWAQGIDLKTQLMQQFYTNIVPEDIFINCMQPCRLDKIFQRKKERYFKRTSSAHWTSPILQK